MILLTARPPTASRHHTNTQTQHNKQALALLLQLLSQRPVQLRLARSGGRKTAAQIRFGRSAALCYAVHIVSQRGYLAVELSLTNSDVV